jgi:hypothetical protein
MITTETVPKKKRQAFPLKIIQLSELLSLLTTLSLLMITLSELSL